MANEEQKRNIIKLAGASVIAYAIYRLFNTRTVKKINKEIVDVIVDDKKEDSRPEPEKSGKTVKPWQVKGSPEAKAHMAKLQAMRKGGKRKSKKNKSKK